MPLQDLDNARDRFRSVRPQRPRYMSDVRVSGAQNFPAIGMSLPPQPIPYAAAPTPALAQSTSETLGTPFRAAPRLAKPRRRLSVKRVLLTLLISIVVLALFVGGYLGWKVVGNTLKIFHGNVFSILTTTKLKGEDEGRVNILLAGNSADDPGHNGANLTDSIMVVSIDTKHNTAFMLSVPRDLWVAIPGYGHAKINEAYVDGQAGSFNNPGYPSGGMGLLSEVVQQNFGLPIDYYALIDYNAVRDAVDAIGGIDVTINSVDSRGLYDPSIDYATHGPLVKLSNGVHHINGEQALDLARARGDAYGSYGFPLADFNRTQNQRMMILAIKQKAMSLGVLANPISLGNLFDSVGKNVQTNLTLSGARRMYDLTKVISNNSIQSVGLNSANGKDLLASYFTPTNEDALIPAAGLDDFSQIQLFVQRLTSNNPVLQEAASVVILNGTNTSGLAAQAKTVLTNKSVDVTAISNTTHLVTATQIIDASAGKMPNTLALLKSLYGQNIVSTNPYAAIYPSANFIVILGPDQVQTGSSSSQ